MEDINLFGQNSIDELKDQRFHYEDYLFENNNIHKSKETQDNSLENFTF
jgi:hypothetical protein